MTEHPVEQTIIGIDVSRHPMKIHAYRVGERGVTRIEACTKSGLHADLPYVRVWKGEVCEAEFCQHNIVGVYFSVPDLIPSAPTEQVDWRARAEAAEARLKDIGDWAHDRSTGPAIPDDLWEIRRMAYDL